MPCAWPPSVPGVTSLGERRAETAPEKPLREGKSSLGCKGPRPTFPLPFKRLRRTAAEGLLEVGAGEDVFHRCQDPAGGPEGWAALMSKKGKHTSHPDPDLDSLRQTRKRIINKMKCAWRCGGGPAGRCQFENPWSRPESRGPQCARGCGWGGDGCLPGLRAALGNWRSGWGFSGEQLESSQLCPGSVRPRPGGRPGELVTKGGVQDAPGGAGPSFLVRERPGCGEPTSHLLEHPPIPGFQPGPALRLCWKYLGRFLPPPP